MNQNLELFIHIHFKDIKNTEDTIFLKVFLKHHLFYSRIKTKLLQKHQSIAELKAGKRKNTPIHTRFLREVQSISEERNHDFPKGIKDIYSIFSH